MRRGKSFHFFTLIFSALLSGCIDSVPVTSERVSAANASASVTSTSTQTSAAPSASKTERCAALGVYTTRASCEAAQVATCSSAVFSWGDTDIACWRKGSSGSTITLVGTSTSTSTVTTTAVSPPLYGNTHLESDCTSYSVISRRSDGANERRFGQVQRILSSYSVCKLPIQYDQMQSAACPNGWRSFTSTTAGQGGNYPYYVIQTSKNLPTPADPLLSQGLTLLSDQVDTQAPLRTSNELCLPGCAVSFKIAGTRVCIIPVLPGVISSLGCTGVSYMGCY